MRDHCQKPTHPGKHPHWQCGTGIAALALRRRLGHTGTMTPALANLAMPLLRRLDAERAHGLALRALRAGLAGQAAAADPRLASRVLGMELPNPIGLAAGFDKDGAALAALMRLGFGAIEVGTVTPLPQPGNPRPRLFRLSEDRAIINRMGFNNAGVAALLARLPQQPHQVPLGVNVGLNKSAADPLRDYPALIAAVAPRADYVVINVSSPNTRGLRDLQAPRRLAGILAAIHTATPKIPPLLVKLAPDLAAGDLPDIVAACLDGGAQGLIVANTTIARPHTLRSRHAAQPGGLSGAPLLAASTAMLAQVARISRGRLVLVGAGGIASGADVLAKLRAGASFVQLYTAFALHGPSLLPRLQRELLAAMDAAGHATVTDAIGADL